MFVLVLTINTGLTQPGSIPVSSTILDDDEHGNDPGHINSNCELVLEIPIYVSNLMNVVTYQGNTFYTLPSDRPEMEFHYSYGNHSGVIPVIYFEEFGSILDDHGNIITLFKSVVEIVIDVSDECLASGSDGVINLEYNTALMTVGGYDIYEEYFPPAPYPICDFMDSDDIFACEMFEFCEGLPPGELPEECFSGRTGLHASNGNADFTCHSSCGQHNFSGSEGRSIIKTQLIESVSPNPFYSTFKIGLNKVETIQEVLIYGTNGSLVYKNTNIETIVNGNTISFDLPDAAPGIYFLNITTKDSNEIVKLFKY